MYYIVCILYYLDKYKTQTCTRYGIINIRNGCCRMNLCIKMSCCVIILVLCLLIYWQIHGSNSDASQTINGTVFINTTVPIGTIDDDFVCATLDWWPPEKCDYGTCSWGRASLLNLDLTNPILSNAIKAFSPLKIRLGGTLQDKVKYQIDVNQQPCNPFVKNESDLFGFSQGCLPMSRWDELNDFFKRTGAVVIFGLNALNGKIIDSKGSAIGAWDSSDAESLIQYSVYKGYTIHGWELGNELSGSGIGARVAADQYASDTNTLQRIVQKIYAGFEVEPLVLAPGGFFDANWFTEFINKTTKSLQVVTHHIYNLGPGNDKHLIEKILDPSLLGGESQTLNSLQNILKSSGTSAVAWIGEAGGAYNSGHNRVTNAFVFSFWYLDQLGMAASYNTKTYCRQTLIGGNYGLLNTNNFVPNPDYYSALLWHRLMGNNVLSTSFSGTKKMRAYAHCSKKDTQGITLLLINLDDHTRVQVSVSTDQSGTSPETPNLRNSKTTAIKNNMREEYHLEAKHGDLQTQVLVLNGKKLTVDLSGAIPPLEPIYTRMSDSISVAPSSIVFVRIPNISLPACT